jgi:integrase
MAPRPIGTLDSEVQADGREVEMSPELVEVIRAHIDRLRRYGRSTTPEDYVFQNNKGRRMSHQSVGKTLTEAALAASKTLCEHDLPTLPQTTPHSMRRTYISTALLANNFDVAWVMKQVDFRPAQLATAKGLDTAAVAP